MTLTQLWGAFFIFLICPILGALPLIHWLTLTLKGQDLTKLGTGNVSVSAAFYHSGTVVGILAVLSEAAKGIAAVVVTRQFFPQEPVWELIALMALVMGRYVKAQGAGTTNVVWGIVAHDPIVAGFIALIGGVGFTVVRDRVIGRNTILVLMPLMIAAFHPDDYSRIVGAIVLSGLLFTIYYKIPDDLDLPNNQGNTKIFKFFRGDRGIFSLDDKLQAHKVGQKAATLSQLKRWGYPVPQGWVLPAGDDPAPLIDLASPSEQNPLIVRSSAIGEDTKASSAAGQYQSVSHITNKEALQDGILQCQASYNYATAAQYRRLQQQQDSAMAVLVQQQIRGEFSGVAFSRDPVNQIQDAVVIEALPGEAAQVVSGEKTPEQYRVIYHNGTPEIEGEGNIPTSVLEDVAGLARELEDRFHGLPQDMEWTFDGETLWLLQSRPITNLQPIWTRKIAAEVIPGVIRPLTWSINRPLTCQVWGNLFKICLGDRAKDLNFNQTATLHYSRAYFNATLLGEIFQRMGLPPESLEFLTRGAKLSRPSLFATVGNLPGLARLSLRELRLNKEFAADKESLFLPTLQQLQNQSIQLFSPQALLTRIEMILNALQTATYYNILAPISFSLRQNLLQVSDQQLNYNHLPEVASSHELAQIAREARNLVPTEQMEDMSAPSLFATLAELPDGESILEQFQDWLGRYGYLSEAATDIAVPRWQENPSPARSLFAQFFFHDGTQPSEASWNQSSAGWKQNAVQKRLDLKAETAEIYNRLLAHLRWSFLALEQIWLDNGLLAESGDIFFLKLSEVRQLIKDDDPQLREQIPYRLRERRFQFSEDEKMTIVPYVVYGNPPQQSAVSWNNQKRFLSSQKRWEGIGASSGQATGRIKVIPNLSEPIDVNQDTIVVVPYTDAGWGVLLARAGGLISEVGGRLSHGAIIAREYGVPAVMNIPNAIVTFQDGQLVKIDGATGVVELLEN